MDDFSNLSDEQLDAAYSDATKAGQWQTAARFGLEIIARLATPASFFAGLIGKEHFPLYAASTKFSQVDSARTSVSDNAAIVGKKIASSLQFGGSTIALVAVAFILYKVTSK